MSTKANLRSNGFGRIEQRIVFSVPTGHEKSLPDDMDIALLHRDTNTSPPRSFFLWRRWTTRRGDDEDIVFELFQTLGAPSTTLGWEMDWEASTY
jgi:hypothetical protein